MPAPFAPPLIVVAPATVHDTPITFGGLILMIFLVIVVAAVVALIMRD